MMQIIQTLRVLSKICKPTFNLLNNTIDLLCIALITLILSCPELSKHNRCYPLKRKNLRRSRIKLLKKFKN